MSDDDLRNAPGKLGEKDREEPTRKLGENEAQTRQLARSGNADPETIAEAQKPVRAAAPQPGDRIAQRYSLERQLGSGGMGDVYLAQDELRGRRVALKLLRRHVAGNLVIVNRFRREARITAQLSSPHAVKVHDFGQTDDGSLYLAMELLDGESLADRIAQHGPLESYEAVSIAADIARGLSTVHAVGIVHRTACSG